MYTYIYIYTYIFECVCVCVCGYVFVCVCICVCECDVIKHRANSTRLLKPPYDFIFFGLGKLPKLFKFILFWEVSPPKAYEFIGILAGVGVCA